MITKFKRKHSIRRERTAKRDERTPARISGEWLVHSPPEHTAHILGLAFAHDEFLAIVESYQPSLTGDHAHLSNLFNVHERISVNPSKRADLQSFFEPLG